MRNIHLVGFSTLLCLACTKPAAASERPEPGDYFRICPPRKCDGCSTIDQLRAPGIGFDLGTTGGTAAVRLHDGSHHRVALIEGDASYIALLQRLGTGPTKRTPDHFDSTWDKLRYIESRARRQLNKLLGRPATEDIAILSGMVAALRDATQAWLGDQSPVSTLVLSSPDRIRLTDEEMGDIFDYLGLKNLMAIPDTLETLRAASAAYAGYGQGLCTNYTDAEACDREEWYLPSQDLLHIDFTDAALSCTVKRLSSVRDGLVQAAFIDPLLGHRWNPGPADASHEIDNGEFWGAVSARVRELVLPLKSPVTELLLTGTHVNSTSFQDAVKDALYGLVGDEALANLDLNLMEGFFPFVIAQGAAEVAKRRQEGPVRCRQSDECRSRREREHAAADSARIKEAAADVKVDL